MGPLIEDTPRVVCFSGSAVIGNIHVWFVQEFENENSSNPASILNVYAGRTPPNGSGHNGQCIASIGLYGVTLHDFDSRELEGIGGFRALLSQCPPHDSILKRLNVLGAINQDTMGGSHAH